MKKDNEEIKMRRNSSYVSQFLDKLGQNDIDCLSTE